MFPICLDLLSATMEAPSRLLLSALYAPAQSRLLLSTQRGLTQFSFSVLSSPSQGTAASLALLQLACNLKLHIDRDVIAVQYVTGI